MGGNETIFCLDKTYLDIFVNIYHITKTTYLLLYLRKEQRDLLQTINYFYQLRLIKIIKYQINWYHYSLIEIHPDLKMLYSDICTILTFNYNGKHLSQVHRGVRIQASSSLQYRLIRLYGAINKKKLQAAQKYQGSLKTQLGFYRLLEGNWQHR